MVPAQEPVEIPQADCPPMAELMLRFEALGLGCEFGVAQRCCGADPLGLFRFADSSIDNLVALLNKGFEGFLTSDDLGVEVRSSEYMVFSKCYAGFHSHTNTWVDVQDATTLRARAVKKTAYLKRRFELDWHDAARIYVHCGTEDDAAVVRLHATLRRRSDCTLLWVVVARQPQDRGRVEIVCPGLLKGYLGHGCVFDRWGARLDLPAWALVCRAADAMVRGSQARPPREIRRIEAEFCWTHTRYGAVVCGERVGRCRILHDLVIMNSAADLTITADLLRKSLVVVSVWVRLSAAFDGRLLVLTTSDAVWVNHHYADLTLVDTWQQVWIVVKIPADLKTLKLCFTAEASRLSEFVIGGWQIEAGGMPSEDLRPGDDIVGSHAEVTSRIQATPGPHPMPASRSRTRRWIASRMRFITGRLDPEPEIVAESEEDATMVDCLRLSNVLMAAGRFSDADAVLVAGKGLYPWRAELYSHLALCAEVRADVPMAAARWSEAIERFPQYALGHYRLAAALREQGQTERALLVIEAALPHHLDDPGMVSEAARVFAAAHRWPDSTAQWEHAVALSGDRPEWRDERALAARMATASSERTPSRVGTPE